MQQKEFNRRVDEAEPLVTTPPVDHNFALVVPVFESWAGADFITLPFDFAEASSTGVADFVRYFDELEHVFLYGLLISAV
jgi:hypothetical protein